MRHPIQLTSSLLFLGLNSPRIPAKQTLPLYLEAATVKTSTSDKDVNMTVSELFSCLFNLVTGSAEERERKDRQKEKGVAKGKKNMQTTFSAFTSDASCNELYIYHHL